MIPSTDAGSVHLTSPYSVPETTNRVESALQSQGISIFCHIDHSGEAEKIGMKMYPTQLLIVGDPKSGTPLMLAPPTLAIDLPLKILVWQDAGNKLWLSYNSPECLQHHHNLPPELPPSITGLGILLQAVLNG